ncbi:hypothetical protein ABFX02_05G020800 [Erythranthe guttata]
MAEKNGGSVSNGLISCSLKRKRPPRIEIPNVLREVSTDTFKGCGGGAREKGDGGAAVVCFADSGVGVFSLKGKKKFMEDSHKILSSSSSNGNKGFYGVYDGHGGSKAVEFVAENLHLNIFDNLNNISENKAKEEAVKAGYLKTDQQFLKLGIGSGACCVTALIEEKEMVVSNLGDCRAVLCRGGVAEPLTTDHRPTREDERSRIQDKGGYVEIHRGTWRVHGTLAVSRSIGDSHMKDWVLAEPDTRVVCLTSDMQYLVLASDGLWDEVSNQEAVDIVMRSCSSDSNKKQLVTSNRRFRQERSEDCENRSPPPSKYRRITVAKKTKIKNHFSTNENQVLIEKSGGLMAACKELVSLAVSRGSLDDITVMIVDLNHYRGL